MQLEVNAALNDQELRLKPIMYWEGLIRTSGTVGNKDIRGAGYLEMTGYAGPVAGIQAEP